MCLDKERLVAVFIHRQTPPIRNPDFKSVRQAALSEAFRLCFFGGVGPGCSKRNWVRSLMACARIKLFCRQWLIVFIETPQARAISEIVSIPRSRRRSKRLF